MKNILHICAGWEKWNGAANIARMIMGEQSREGRQVSFATWAGIGKLRAADVVWIHCSWKPCLWWAALWGRNVHWMPECSYDPIRRRYHGWKKWLVGPIERFCLRRAKALVATCEAEAGWIRAYLGEKCPPIEITDIKRFFKLGNRERIPRAKRVAEGDALAGVGTGTTGKTGQTRFPADRPLHLLYLGRQHPLKGLEFLEEAVRQISSVPHSPFPVPPQLKVVSNAFGEELEKVWNWCDVLVLPTLSDNFGLVVAEALERGKRVITTDGAPAWNHEIHETHEKGVWSGYGGRLIYLKGYRDGNAEKRVELLKSAIERVCK